jgi:hypothetical protein
MNTVQAAELLEQHRRHWCSHDSDHDVARRAEKLYLQFAVGLAVGALLDLLTDLASGGMRLWRVWFAAGILLVAAAFYWQSFRFNRIRKLLARASTDSLKDLNERNAES